MSIARAGLLLAVLALLVSGCAPKAVTLKPGEASWGDVRDGGDQAWSLWVDEVRDLRPGADGAKVGLFYPKFQSEPQTVYVKPEPARYVRQEMSRYLLHRGLEASEGRRAKLLLRVELTEFSLAEAPGSVMDEITVQVGYTVRFVDQRGSDLGHMRLQGSRIIQTPVAAQRKAEEGFRDALADTFDPLLQSEVFAKVMSQVGKAQEMQ